MASSKSEGGGGSSGSGCDASSSTSSSKQDEGIRSRLKQFFSIGGSKSGGPQSAGNVKPPVQEYVLTQELVKDLSPGNSLEKRLKLFRDLCEVVLQKYLEQGAVEVLFECAKDLLQPSMPKEARMIALKFFACICKGQYEHLKIMRSRFFNLVKKHDVFEDLPERLEILRMLSHDGKDLEHFEEEAGEFLLNWMRDVMSSPKIGDFLQVLVNVIKYNAAYVDEEVLAGLVLNTCLIANKTSNHEHIKLCLLLLDTVVRYSYLPRSALQHFIVCMCQIVNVDVLAPDALKLMRKVLGTHLGHTAVYTMCCLLQNTSSVCESEAQLMRGAVFFIGMALWGSQKVDTLKYPATAVLPAFIQAVERSGSDMVAHEISLSAYRFVSKYGLVLEVLTWSALLDLLQALLTHVQRGGACEPLVKELHSVIGGIEELIKAKSFSGDQSRFFAMMENCVLVRKEESVLMLVHYKASQIELQQERALTQLQHVVDKYYKQETRTRIRIAVLDLISQLLQTQKAVLEEELLEKVLVPCLQHVDQDPDVEVRTCAAQLLCDVLLHTHLSIVTEVLAILNKVVMWPFKRDCASATPSHGAAVGVGAVGSGASPHTSPVAPHRNPAVLGDVSDIRTAVSGLVALFRTRLYENCGPVLLTTFNILIQFLKEEYNPTHLRPRGASIRKSILDCFLRLRSDGLYRLGLLEAGSGVVARPVFSPYAVCMPRSDAEPGSSSGAAEGGIRPVVLPYAEIFHCIRLALEQELDWGVLRLVLESLPQVLQNKTLLLSAEKSDLDSFCLRLTVMVSERGPGVTKLLNAPQGASKYEFHVYIFPVLSCLVSYQQYLDKQKQRELVKCLEFGLVSQSARVCVSSLAVCALENGDVMMRQLPSVLLKLTQISATTSMALPLMEFLSSLLHLPELYANFVEDHYMSVFAIALPYTNPCKYTHYTVSLAYHVIAMWFLKCRIAFRKGFVGFIVKGLRTNVLRQFEENAKARARQNQDSANRNRSQSQNDEAFRRRSSLPENGSAAKILEASYVSSQPAPDHHDQSKGRNRLAAQAAVARTGVTSCPAEADDMSGFHRELTETCVDMLATYTFSTFSCLPKRSPTTDFLLSGGQSQSWLLGNRVITITTSGGARVTKAGLCQKCLSTARKASEQQRAETDTPDVSAPTARRRHRSAAVHASGSTPPVTLKPASQDDLFLRRRESTDGMFGGGGSLGGGLPRIPSEGLDSTEDLRRHGNSELTNGLARSDGSDQVVATRSGKLVTKTDKIQAVDDVLLSLRPRESDTSIFSARLCSCWCTQWAEVHIRRPTGSLAWIMRIENEQDLTEVFPDYSLADISNLFKNTQVPAESELLGESDKIDSQSLGEHEYESLLEQHFHTPPTDAFTRAVLPSPQATQSNAPAPPMQDFTKDSSLPENITGLRKAVSSPELLPGLIVEAPTPEYILALADSVPPLTQLKEDTSNGHCTDTNTSGADGAQTPVSNHGAGQKSVVAAQEASGANSGTTTSTDSHGTVLSSPANQGTSSDVSTNHGASPSGHMTSPTNQGTAVQRDQSNVSFSLDNLRTRPKLATNESLPLASQKTGTATGSADQASRPAGLDLQGPRIGEPDVAKRLTGGGAGGLRELVQGGISPSFVFLQLFHNHCYPRPEDRPLLLPRTEPVERALKNLDRIYAYETHKIGVLYVAPGQPEDETLILCNTHGSERYVALLQGLGHLLRLADCSPERVYLGGLDHERGADGKYALSWHDEFMQVIFHAATLMPARASDPKCNAKKLHIGNDYVSIVYNDSGESYSIHTIKCQFNYVNIVIEPLDHNSNAVTVQCKDIMSRTVVGSETIIISDTKLPLLVRQMAVHANLASTVVQRSASNLRDPFASNWLERLRQIKRLRSKVAQDAQQSSAQAQTTSSSAGSSGSLPLVGSSGQPSPGSVADSAAAAASRAGHNGMGLSEDFTDYC